MGNIFQFSWEIRLIELFQEFISNNLFLYHIFSFITLFGESYTTVMVMGLFYWYLDKNNGKTLARNMVFAQLNNSMIKNLFSRIRPYVVNDSIDCLKVVEPGYDIYDMNKQGYSFPSGHATNVSSIVFTIYNSLKRKKILSIGLIVIILVSISRFALGVHYPSDVIVGSLFGCLIVYLLAYLDKKIDKKIMYILLGLYALIGVFFCTSNDYYSTLGLYIGFVFGELFEEKFVNFKNTNNLLKGIIRTLLGGLLFIGISYVLKMPFDKEVLEAHNNFAYFYRVFRYGFTCFIVIGVYPILFKYNLLKLKD